MSTPPETPWIDQGFEAEPAPVYTNTTVNRKPALFAIGAGVVLMVVLISAFFIRVISNGRDAADARPAGSTSASSPASGKMSESNEKSEPSEASSDFARLASSTACKAKKDSDAVITYASSADFSAAKASETLSQLSKKCGAEYTSDLSSTLAMQKGEAASLGSSHEWWALKAPAPQGALEVKEFTTPQNNIRCQFGESDVNCSIYVYDYPSPEGCEGKTATYHLGVASDPTADCKSALNSSVTIDYGTTVKHNGLWCTASQTEGVTCTSELSGKGFQLARAADRLF